MISNVMRHQLIQSNKSVNLFMKLLIMITSNKMVFSLLVFLITSGNIPTQILIVVLSQVVEKKRKTVAVEDNDNSIQSNTLYVFDGGSISIRRWCKLSGKYIIINLRIKYLEFR